MLVLNSFVLLYKLQFVNLFFIIQKIYEKVDKNIDFFLGVNIIFGAQKLRPKVLVRVAGHSSANPCYRVLARRRLSVK